MIDPRGLTVIDWTDSMNFVLLGLVVPPRLDNAAEWKHWALQVGQNAAISRFNAPDPRLFDDWREWAFRFNEAVQL